ncbi:MAG TPA: M20/M25/M40 family metallo-hydrolase [Thermoanaerobaculia bacterium]|nr:M20/M25/M40 family metallo-hydrolase [Thermoanaerobaculia bacterium]
MVDRAGNRSVVSGEERGGGWGLLVALVLLALVLVLANFRTQPPAPKPADASMQEFSAVRAREVLKTLLGDGAPHPTGSEANARVRERIVAHLRWLGFAPEVRESFVCNRFGSCGQVANVVARLEGREPGKAVLLMAHYDSVPAGPGVGDDLAGVAAILEVARILKAGPPPRHPVIFLLDDAEEAGLLGAEAFVRSPDFSAVGVVVNLEGRGNSGPSLMFETSGQDGWTVPRFTSRASRPITSSLFVTIYDQMPNDTDLTLFKQRDVPGLNFAFVGNPLHYHSPLDTLENLSLESLQHHGDNALAAVRGLTEADLASPPPGKAVFFDVLGAFVVLWPAGWSLGLAALALVLVIVAVVLGLRRGAFTGGALAMGLLLLPGTLFLSGALAFGIQTLLRAAFPAPWIANPLPATVVFWLIPLAVTLGLAAWLARRSGAAGIWAGTWIWWAALGLLLAVIAPGTSYLFLVPALVAGLAGVVSFSSAPGVRAWAALLPMLVAALLWLPFLQFLYLGLGLMGLMVAAVLLSLFDTTVAPLAAAAGPGLRKWAPLAAGALAAIFAVVAMVSPPFSPKAPQNMVVQFHQDVQTGEARWLLRAAPPIPQALREAAAFDPQPGPAYPWSPSFSRAFKAKAPALPIPGPELAVLSDSSTGGKRTLRLRLTSPRGARVGTVMVPQEAKLESLRIGGQAVEVEPRSPGAPAQGWRPLTVVGLPSQGVELDVVLGESRPFDWFAADRSDGLPPSGRALLDARPDNAVPLNEGDTTLVSRKVRI